MPASYFSEAFSWLPSQDAYAYAVMRGACTLVELVTRLLSCKHGSWIPARPTMAAQVAQEAPASVFSWNPHEVSANSAASIDQASRRSRSLRRSTRRGVLPTRYASIQAFLYKFFPRPLAAAALFVELLKLSQREESARILQATDLLQDIWQNPLSGFFTSSFITKAVAPDGCPQSCTM